MTNHLHIDMCILGTIQRLLFVSRSMKPSNQIPDAHSPYKSTQNKTITLMHLCAPELDLQTNRFNGKSQSAASKCGEEKRGVDFF